MAQLEDGLAAWQATGSALLRPYFLSLVAEAQQHSGQLDAALHSLDQALQAVEEHGERFYEAELHRRKGECLLAREDHPQTSAAEACFQRAIEIARRQRAKSLELRAAMSLGRLWQTQNKTAEARQLLAEVSGWFAPELETVDLQQARLLLEGWAER